MPEQFASDLDAAAVRIGLHQFGANEQSALSSVTVAAAKKQSASAPIEQEKNVSVFSNQKLFDSKRLLQKSSFQQPCNQPRKFYPMKCLPLKAEL